MIAGAESQITNHYYQFGENLGLAFQIQDDILGAWGDERVTGKSAATDIRDKKKTLPVVYVLNHPDERLSAWQLVDLYSQEGPLDKAGIQTTLTILERAGARAYAEEMAESYYQRALESLAATGNDNEPRAALHELAASLLRRET
jgi:geranylgeranyl diphosphate synthase type I